VAGIAAVLVWTGAAASAPPGLKHREHRVEIRDLAFVPAVIRVEPGDTVYWRNDDLVPHTVTAADSSWNSGELPPGGEFRWVSDGPESIAYTCLYHPSMTGRLEFEGDPDAGHQSAWGSTVRFSR
jgi:plastocyanin